ncbi:hypothetical protein RQP54_01545 [Curvibacter sp. APW13]|uniref:hypothetical protein n=1 Tax=Curvibacter sp. APW13 TaxID=3077236 RepID=UPI0028DFDD3A|nr:hypothetical protein [Curvibacter sp. APW13]MDT8989540.1 hypothetical protein [Curvibacter sp. APW13]
MPRTTSKTLIQATLEAPGLARYASLIDQSQKMLAAVQPLLPPHLRNHIKAGPLAPENWCLFAANNSVAAKLRQLQPTLEAHLRSKGWETTSIRVKVLA